MLSILPVSKEKGNAEATLLTGQPIGNDKVSRKISLSRQNAIEKDIRLPMEEIADRLYLAAIIGAQYFHEAKLAKQN